MQRGGLCNYRGAVPGSVQRRRQWHPAGGGAALLPAGHRWPNCRGVGRVQRFPPSGSFTPSPSSCPQSVPGAAVLPPSRSAALAPPPALADDTGWRRAGAYSFRSQANPFLCRRLLLCCHRRIESGNNSEPEWPACSFRQFKTIVADHESGTG
jgi:hypothetical protein